MLAETIICLILAASSRGFLLRPKDEPNLKVGNMESPEYDAEVVAARVDAAWRNGEPIHLWELSGLREGDIIDPVGGQGRNMIRDEKFKWPNNTVVYKFQPGMTYNEKMAIRQGFKMISNGTCIKFREARPSDKDYVYMLWDAAGCDSHVGFQGGAQAMHLSRSGCLVPGIVAHETLHAIGLEHMHCNFNRDEYITVNFTNIKPNGTHNFDIRWESDYTDYGLPYDYESIMHYDQFAFHKISPTNPNWGPEMWTMVSKQDGAKIGNDKYLTKIDYMKVNIRYQCPGYENITKVHIVTRNP